MAASAPRFFLKLEPSNPRRPGWGILGIMSLIFSMTILKIITAYYQAALNRRDHLPRDC